MDESLSYGGEGEIDEQAFVEECAQRAGQIQFAVRAQGLGGRVLLERSSSGEPRTQRPFTERQTAESRLVPGATHLEVDDSPSSTTEASGSAFG
jgi:hypothetical protein